MGQDIQTIQTSLESFFRHYVRTIASEIKACGYDGAPQDMRILSLAKISPGISVSEIVLEMGRDKGQITRKVKELESKGLIRRETPAADKRVSALYLTGEGEAVASELLKIKGDVLKRVFAPLQADEKRALSTLMGKVVAEIDA